MKVIWAKDKLQEVYLSKTIKISSNNNLVKMKGSHMRLIEDKQHPNHAVTSATEGAGDEWAQCRVCNRDTGLRCITDNSDGAEACDRLLYDCFGLKVSDPSYKICGQCAELIRTSHKFKEMVCAALCPVDRDLSESSIADQLSFEEKQMDYSESEERVYKPKVAVKRKPQPLPQKAVIKKTIVVCTVCRQKYPMMSCDTAGFVCSRCKIRKSSDRTVACVKCGHVVHARQMKEHLEMHAKTDLKGRCRLRSLPKKPSKAQTADASKKQQHKQIWLHCKSCAKKFANTKFLADHMRKAHGEYLTYICGVCGKDMRTKDFLDKHMKSHERSTLFECDKCGKIFKTRIAFQRHYMIHKETTAA